MRRAPVVVAAAVVVAVAVGFGLYWFAPWRLFTNTTVDDVLPSVALQPVVTAEPTLGAQPTLDTAPSIEPEPTDVVLARGTFRGHEHATTGEAQLVRLADGRVQLLLVGLDTSDGPDLHVWLTDQPVGDDWFTFDDGVVVELGSLKGNQGNQVYDVPAGTDLDGLRSVTIWCKRFNVSFGAAELV